MFLKFWGQFRFFFFCFIIFCLFLEQFLSARHWYEDGMVNSNMLSPSPLAIAPLSLYSQRCIYYNWWTYIDTSLSPKVHIVLRLCHAIHSTYICRRIVTFVHHYIILQNIFTALSYSVLLMPSCRKETTGGYHFTFSYDNDWLQNWSSVTYWYNLSL